MILILMEGAEEAGVDIAVAAHEVELKPSGSGVRAFSQFDTGRQPQLIRAVFGCRNIMDIVVAISGAPPPLVRVSTRTRWHV
jgi:hypothetical protein